MAVEDEVINETQILTIKRKSFYESHNSLPSLISQQDKFEWSIQPIANVFDKHVRKSLNSLICLPEQEAEHTEISNGAQSQS